MAKLKGVFRFEDALSLPSGSQIKQNIYFTVSTIPKRAGVQCLMTGSAIAFGNDGVDYGITSSTPGDWISGVGAFPTEFAVFWEGWDTETFGEGIKIIDIPYEQEVSAEFYETFTANTEYIGGPGTNKVTIFYKGEAHTTLNCGEHITLHTKGNTMEDDLRVEATQIGARVDSPLPIEVSTADEMSALLDTAPVGAIYKYVGVTTDKYENGTKYELCEN